MIKHHEIHKLCSLSHQENNNIQTTNVWKAKSWALDFQFRKTVRFIIKTYEHRHKVVVELLKVINPTTLLFILVDFEDRIK